MVKHMRFTLAILLLVASSGCAGMRTQKRLETFEDRTNAYGTLLRWGQYEDAAKYILFRRGEPKPPDFKQLQQIRVTSYDIVDRIITPEQTEATVTVQIGFYHVDSNVLHTLRDQQLWWYDEPTRRWNLESDLPDFIDVLRKNR